MEKSIARALGNAGLDKREVSPFMRVRVVGLTSKENEEKGNHIVGLITIWNPTEKQVNIFFFFFFCHLYSVIPRHLSPA